MMDDDWWPDLMRDFAEEDPWASSQVTVAEVRGYDDPWMPGVRFLWSALVPQEDLDRLGGALSPFAHEVECSGPNPGVWSAGQYDPQFWISAYLEEQRIKAEPLVLSWSQHNQTAMVLDPRFAMTYGLMPRALADGSVHWDDPAAPEFDVAVVDAPSVLGSDHRQSDARVVVSRDHLQDYLTLRGRVLIQVYYETRRGPEDAAIAAMLQGGARLNQTLKDREFDLQHRREGGYVAQVWGARRVAEPGPLPVSADTLDTVGLNWPGLNGAITTEAARRFRPGEGLVYVSDSVLEDYESRPGFSIHPETGGVSFGNQWSVGPVRRVGRDTLQIEVRKLYEGTRSRVIRHWHAHATTPSPALLGAAGRAAPNIGVRARAVVEAQVRLGRALSALAETLGVEQVTVAGLVGLDPARLDYEGWWTGPYVPEICRRVPLDLDAQAFLSRCLSLDKLVVEALGERPLRRMVEAFGEQADMKSKRGLKLLDRLVCLAQVATSAGFSLPEARAETLDRYRSDGTDPAQPLTPVFALSELRQAAGHRKDSSKVADALGHLGLDIAQTRGGWGATLDRIYDSVVDTLVAAAATLEAVAERRRAP